MNTSGFNIDIQFLGGLSEAQQAAFSNAILRWSAVIVGDLPAIRTNIGVVDDVVIDAKAEPLDGAAAMLGQAGPTRLRPGSLLPARGVMAFDTADLGWMEAEDTLTSVIIHEMGHVLGIGTLWQELTLLDGAGTDDPVFVGQNAMYEYARLIGANERTPVPVENTGGPGSRDGHWRESVFGNELMTGFVRSATNPISRLTVACLQDLGYQVDYSAADEYVLPTAVELARLSSLEDAHEHRCCTMTCPDYKVLGQEALVTGSLFAGPTQERLARN